MVLLENVFIKGLLETEIDQERVQYYYSKSYYINAKMNRWSLKRWELQFTELEKIEDDFTLAIEIELAERLKVMDDLSDF